MRKAKDFLPLLAKYLKLSKDLCFIDDPDSPEFVEIEKAVMEHRKELLGFISLTEIAIITAEQFQADKKFMKAMGYVLVDGIWQ